ncbi:J domain-containing protein [Leptolyngbya sp. KIOST-1]|uniref:J domain-containing protein n=1 Tax=Leptolyngbya sp. KIOST-1 TaxID=1229172 RepID=UPI00056AB6A3|nr:J domain-containing protein [Leptolyngbya sp. KIOST-1]
MPHAAFSPEWLNRFTDPYALLGVSVAADERRILKRYRAVAKQLHPDALINATPELQQFAGQVLPKLVNPAYQRLKQDKGRNEVLATLRFKVRRLSRDQPLNPTAEQSKQLLAIPEAEVDVFYEQAVDRLCDRQYETVANFERFTQQLSELNLVYLRRKMGAPVIREKRTGLMSTASIPRSPAPLPADPPSDGKSTSGLMYAERHYSRAQEYLKGKNIQAAIQELKDALKIDPQNSSYHCLIGQAYLLSQLTGMAKVHFKQALRLNPNNAVALKYAQQLKISMSETQPRRAETATTPPPEKRSLFGSLFSRGTSR